MQTDLEHEIEALSARLAHAEAKAINPAVAEISAIRATLEAKRRAHDEIQYAEQSAQAREQAAIALRVAEENLATAKHELDFLRAESDSLPGRIQRQHWQVGQCMREFNAAKQKLGDAQ